MTGHQKESIYLLQRVDCNCNDCGLMVRDMEAYAKWSEFHRQLQFERFTEDREQALFEAYTLRDKTLLARAMKMKLQFRRPPINYGDCNRFGKPVSFIANSCQVETQKCFVHRKD